MTDHPVSLKMATAVQQGQPRQGGANAFTLTELLAVVVVILVLTGLIIGVAGYVQKQVGVSTTKSQIAAISLALEIYKSDWGYYPPTTPWRISHTGIVELTNNAILYRALFCQGKRYLTFPSAQVHAPFVGTGAGGGQKDGLSTNIYDVYGSPFNYYCSPKTPFSTNRIVTPFVSILLTSLCTAGGQVNVSSYDLLSYGRDHATLAATNVYWPAVGQLSAGVTPIIPGAEMITWSNASSTIDDVTNWRR